LNPTFEPKGADRTSPAQLPPARFLGQLLYNDAGCLWQARAGTHSCAHPAIGGTRKLSVPGRVHSVPKSCGFSETRALPESNPFVTRGTVESPAKCQCAARSKSEESRSPPIRPQGSGRPTRCLAGGGSPKFNSSSSSSWNPAPGTPEPGHSRNCRPSRARPLWPACTPAPWSQ
jgi:hypothetical protein